MIQTAINYKLPCFPVRGKIPAIKDWQKLATADPQKLAELFKVQYTGIGLATGAISGITCIDVDNKNGVNGFITLKNLGIEFPPTVCVITPGGGKQFYFKYTSKLKNMVGAFGKDSAIDIRNDGGLVIMPPSVHPNGGIYEFMQLQGLGEIELAEIPAEFMELLLVKSTEGAFKLSEIIIEGNRNDHLFKYACKLRAAGMEKSEILAALVVINKERTDSPLSESEINVITESACGYNKPPEPIVKPDKSYAYALVIKEEKAGGKYIYCLEDDKFYYYKEGYWQSLFEVEFLGIIQESMKEIIRHPISLRRQIIDNFKQLGRIHLEQFNFAPLINLKNGMINPYDGILQDHKAEYYSTNRLPYNYNAEAKCDLWIKSINEILENDQKKISILQEFFGYCLTRDVKQHKAMLLLGESRSGKSTLLQVLRNVVGSNNCSSVPLKYIADSQATPILINKLVNIDTDVSAKAEEFEAEFKTITSGEPIHCNQKFIAAFDFVPYCKLIMAANIFPKITDHSSAFYNRLLLIPCDRVFSEEEQNRDLPKQLEAESSGILNWSIEGLRRLTERGRFEQHDFMRDAVQELEDENNPINVFFDDYIEITMGTDIEKGELFERYKTWAERTKNYILSQARFASCVFKRFHKHTPKSARVPGGKRIWKNLRYVEFKSANVPDKGWQE